MLALEAQSMTFQKAKPMTNPNEKPVCFIKHWCTFIMKV